MTTDMHMLYLPLSSKSILIGRMRSYEYHVDPLQMQINTYIVSFHALDFGRPAIEAKQLVC